MSQNTADYLEGYGRPIPQNDFILVEIRDKKEEVTAGGIIKSATEKPQPYVIVVEVSPKVQKSEIDIQAGDIIEMVDVRNLLMFEGWEGRKLALIDKKNVGAVYRKDPNYVPVPKKAPRKLKTLQEIEGAPPKLDLQIVGADERDTLV